MSFFNGLPTGLSATGARRRLSSIDNLESEDTSSSSSPSSNLLERLLLPLERMRIGFPEVAPRYMESDFISTTPYSIGDMHLDDPHYSYNTRRLRSLERPSAPRRGLSHSGRVQAPPLYSNSFELASRVVSVMQYLSMMKLIVSSLESSAFDAILEKIEEKMDFTPSHKKCLDTTVVKSLKSILEMSTRQSKIALYNPGSITAKDFKIALRTMSFMLQSQKMNEFRAELQEEINADCGRHKISFSKLIIAFNFAIELVIS
ncbi:hypothetical protein CRE_07626 [Caenorhabditis remanei]|uniref:Uncharacterized protein n=1 Tax=Caenorhabditis remanei TaxID=31234 RepID=E3MPA8_CAERE|nr:hypothetical protein CRE_07626 [Caenorhabditis remanei]